MKENFNEEYQEENNEIFKNFQKYFDECLSKDQNDYKINHPQWNKMVEIIEYLLERFPATDKDVEPFHIVPAIGTGGTSIKFCVASLDNALEIFDFANTLLMANRVTFDANVDNTVSMEMVVSSVFIPKDEEEREVL